ncbi:hypothetical protein HOH67_03345, partial [Candidatus Peregrinibacteria bacterium]|nr:hypothetical protein [Candidatus Peregrinibacteria bacterium]
FSQESVSAGDYIAIGIAAIIPGLTGGEAKAIKNVGENLINKGAKTLDGPHKLPTTGEPKTTNLKWKDGNIKQGRTYDEAGNPKIDYDFSNHNNSDLPDPHYHKWEQDEKTGEFNRDRDHKPL